MDLLRHGGMGRLFTGIFAPSTLGSFLRSFVFGHVRQLDAVAARLVVNLAGQTPVLPDVGQIAYLDVDDTIRATYGYAKQGVGYGYSGVKGLNALIAALSTPSGAPVIVATRLRKGSANSARGAARLVADALKTSRACGASGEEGLLVVRADSAFYGRDVVAAITRAKARFSITARQDAAVKRAIAGISEDAWTTIRYPHAVFDEQLGQWVSDAEVAEVPFTAFASRGKKYAVAARLIVRRVRDQNPDHLVADEQGELFPAWRHHAVFTDSPLVMLQAEADHRHPRHHRAGHRRPQGRPARPSAVGEVQRQRRLAGPGRDGVQPHPRRRRAGLAVPRQSHHSHHPAAADQRPPPDRSAPPVASTSDYRQTGPGPTPGSTCSPPHSHHPPEPSPDHRPHGHDDRKSVEQPGRPATLTRPNRAHRTPRSTGLNGNTLRCIRA